MRYTIDQILETMNRKNFPVFTNESKKFNLNLIGVRTVDDDSNSFNDYIYCLYKHNGVWNALELRATTDPGLYWRENPMNIDGTAILCEGHHRGIWKLGLHQGRYKALVQRGLASVYRDNNKDEVLDMTPESMQTGYFGINLHRSNPSGTSTQVDKWSAGCQVVANVFEYDKLMEMCDQAARNWGDSFSYTLLLDTWIDELV